MAGSQDLSLYWRLVRRARGYWIHIAGIFLIGLLASPLALLTPLPVKIAVDSVIGDHPVPGFLAGLVPADPSGTAILVLAVTLLVGVTLASQAQAIGGSLLRAYTGERLVLELRSELFRYVQRLSFTYSDAKGTADTVYRIQYDAPAVKSVAIEGVIPFVTAAVTVVAMIVVAARIDWQLALVALGVCPAMFVALTFFRRRLRRQSRQVKKLESSALSIIHEVLAAFRVVKAFGQEDREQQRFEDQSRDGIRRRLQLLLVEGLFGLLIALITAGGTSAVLYLGVTHVQAGRLTLGDLLLVMGYLAQLYSPLRTMSRKVGRLQGHLAGAERVFSVLDETPDVVEKPDARPLGRAAGSVAFNGVAFGYDPERPVLSGVSLEVPAGRSVGISGTTGAGKTTLLSLLTRFYDPDTGSILLDGVDLRDYRLADLRSQFAIVLQDPVLFSTSIAENIAYGRPDATRDEIVAAAETAGAHEFITQLEGGYDTRVGERGMRLSGGERQRIALARAFLKDAPILILDEPTSSVDVRTEGVIMDALAKLMRGRTTFMIAHRTSTLDLCDMLVEVEGGRIASVTERAA